MERDEVTKFVEAHSPGWRPLGAGLIGLWMMILGSGWFLRTPEQAFSALQGDVRSIIIGLISIYFFVIGEAVTSGRLYGWYGGLVGATMLVLMAVWGQADLSYRITVVFAALLIAIYLLRNKEIYVA